MKKQILIILLINIFLITGCSPGHWLGAGEVVAKEKGEKIVQAIVNNDISVLKENFSKNAIDSAEQFDETAEEMLSLFQNKKIVSYGYNYSSDTADIEKDSYVQDADADLFIHTETADYDIYYIVRTEDTIERDNEGISKIVIAETIGNAHPVHGMEEIASDNKGIFIGESRIENGLLSTNGEIEGVEITPLN